MSIDWWFNSYKVKNLKLFTGHRIK